MNKAILDHNDPARVACDSSAQKTFMARMHSRDHLDEALDRAMSARDSYTVEIDRILEEPRS